MQQAIMLTGYPTLETAQAALNLGAAKYCVKPIDNDELEEKVTGVLGAGDQSLFTFINMIGLL